MNESLKQLAEYVKDKRLTRVLSLSAAEGVKQRKRERMDERDKTRKRER
jgi:hypothetical protein